MAVYTSDTKSTEFQCNNTVILDHTIYIEFKNKRVNIKSPIKINNIHELPTSFSPQKTS